MCTIDTTFGGQDDKTVLQAVSQPEAVHVVEFMEMSRPVSESCAQFKAVLGPAEGCA